MPLRLERSMKMSDSLQCTLAFSDVNECSPASDCMHQCENTAGGYNCKCDENFKVDPADSKKCIREYSYSRTIIACLCHSCKKLIFKKNHVYFDCS